MTTTETVPASTRAPRPAGSGNRTARPACLTAALALGVVLTLSACGSSHSGDPTATASTAVSADPSSSESSDAASATSNPTSEANSSTPPASGADGTVSTSTSTGADQQESGSTLTVPAGTRSPQLSWSGAADPDVIAATFVAATWQMDTSADTSPSQAQQRAAQLGTESLAATLAQAPVSSGGAAWSDLVSRSGWTSVEASATSTPDAPDSGSERYRLVNATITAHGDGGWTSTDLFPPVVVYVSLVPDGASWRVEDATTYSS